MLRRSGPRVGLAFALASALALALTLAPVVLMPASAQETTPVLVQRLGDDALVADVDAPATATYRLFNLNSVDDFYVTIATPEPRHWEATASAGEFFLGPREERNVTLTFSPADTPRSDATFEVTFSFVHGSTGEVTRQVESVEVASGAPPRVIGLLPNPLPPPGNNAYGTFALDMLFWVAVGIGTVVATALVVRAATFRAHSDTTRAMNKKIGIPLFLFVILLGLARSFAILPRNPVTAFIAKFLIAIAVTVFGLYLLYRGLDALLVYYQKELAPRTATKVDDVLVPAFRKVGLVVIYVVGIVMTLRNLGWDPTLIFAGAGIAGLVIAFAAQDTFSNLFSGIFLMLDRPFVEGDDIQLESGDTARVVSIGLRTTRLHNYQSYEDVIVPNNQLATKRIINHTSPDPRYRVNIEVGVAYGTDPTKVQRVLLEVANANARVEKQKPLDPTVRFLRFGDSSLDFVLRVVIPHFQQRNEIGSELRYAIVEAFKREGIEIPYPHRVLHLKQTPN